MSIPVPGFDLDFVLDFFVFRAVLSAWKYFSIWPGYKSVVESFEVRFIFVLFS